MKHAPSGKRADYVDPRVEEAMQKAVELLIRNMKKWHSTVDAYWILRKHEDEIGFPLTYNMVEEAVERVKQIMEQGKGVIAAEA